MKKFFNLIILVLLLFSLVSVYAHGEEGIVQAKDIIKQKISCDALDDKQLEVLGEYYMEQMHPGELHEGMDAMMGGEGSENLKQMHINMAKAFYCGEDEMMGSGGMMGMMGSGGMMGGQSGMMGNTYFGWVIKLLIIIVLVLFIIWLIKQLQNPKHRRKN